MAQNPASRAQQGHKTGVCTDSKYARPLIDIVHARAQNCQELRAAYILLLTVAMLATTCGESSPPADKKVATDSAPQPSALSTSATQDTEPTAEMDEAVQHFARALKTHDTEAFKQIIAPSGLVVIRNHSFGNATSGK